MLRRAILGMVLLTAAHAGCFIVTGGTDGYQPAVTADPRSTCAGSADCDAGQVCCANLPASVCQTGPCALAQLCTTTAECGDSGPCASQSCQLDGSTFALEACGALPICAIR